MLFTTPGSIPDDERVESKIKLAIFGVGGGGCNAVSRLMADPKDFDGVKFIAANTDVMALDQVTTEGVEKIALGQELTQGMGAGSNPDIGMKAAVESKADIAKAIEGYNLLFVTAGMGGGTGTGAAPVVATTAQEMGILTVGVVTKPFLFEGSRKMQVAERGIDALRRSVDVLVVVPNEKAFSLAGKNNSDSMVEVFRMADNVLKQSILGVVNIVGRHSVINTDFADIRTVIEKKGMVHIGIGRATGDDRVMDALKAACKNPLMETSVAGAHNVIVDISADKGVSAEKINSAFNMIPEIVAPDANIIPGFGFTTLKDEVTVTIIATAFEDDEAREESDMVRNKKRAEEELLEEFGLKKPEVKPKAQENKEETDSVPAYVRYMQKLRETSEEDEG